MNDIINILLRKNISLAVNLKDSTHAYELSKKADLTYSHVINVINRLEENKLITRRKKGRMFKLILTKKGEEIFNSLGEIYKILK